VNEAGYPADNGLVTPAGRDIRRRIH
jgi:hypothetical protein